MATAIDPSQRQLERLAKAQRLEREHEARLQTMLDHYAKTTVPVERIAANMGETDLNWITAELARRGRS